MVFGNTTSVHCFYVLYYTQGLMKMQQLFSKKYEKFMKIFSSMDKPVVFRVSKGFFTIFLCFAFCKSL